MTSFKKDILTLLKSVLEKENLIQSAWIGGSAATGYEDELSDIDIVVICENPDFVFELAGRSLETVHPIEQIWTVEDSPFKGLFQKFYLFKDLPETFYLDFGVCKSQNPEDYEEYFNTERHGSPVILFDKTKILERASQKPKQISVPTIVNQNFKARFEVIYRTFLKEALRGKYIDSFLFYQRLVLMFIQASRVQNSPQKFDFGFRYIQRDLPAPEAQQIERWLKANELEVMKTNALEIKEAVAKILSV